MAGVSEISNYSELDIYLNSSRRLQEEDDGLPELKVDLYNFEDPSNEDSKYVLTSPRSLEGCAKLGVKPVDLLYKPLAEFQEELLPQDVPLRTIYNIYDEHEQERQRKLKECRDERNKIAERVPVNSKQSSTGRPQRKTETRKYSYLAKKSFTGRPKPRSAEELNKAKGSLQRKRTAWNTSVGHTRVTDHDINKRTKELHDESMKLRNELLSRKEGRSRSQTGTRTKKKAIPRSRSVSSLNSSSGCLLNKSTIMEARPISNPHLKKTLSTSSVDLRSACITPRDEKILELMMTKGEEEKALCRDRYMADLAWEIQRKKEEEAKLSSEMRRRALIAEENRIRQQKKTEKELQRQQLEAELIEEKEKSIRNNIRKWERKSVTQQKMRDLKMSEKKEKEKLRKLSQERNLHLLENDQSEMQDLMVKQQNRMLKTAAQRKQDRVYQESMKKIMSNRQERNNFSNRQRAIEKTTKDDTARLENEIFMKHKHALRNLLQVQQSRDENIQKSQLEREKKALSAKLTQKKLEQELELWRENIKGHRKVVEDHVAEVTSKNTEMKARKAHEDRISREEAQKQTIKKIHQEVEAWRRSTEAELEWKSRKVDSVQQDKETTIQQSRQVAFQSEKLRNELREKYGAESFDKKAFRAELFHKVGLGHLSHKKTL